jgi:von Willebrand factor type A domain
MLPAWLVSLAVHLLLAVAGSLLVSGMNSAEAPAEIIRQGEIVLTRREANRTQYFADEEGGSPYQVLKPVGGSSMGSGAAQLSGASSSDAPPRVTGIDLPDLPVRAPVGEALAANSNASARRGRPRMPVNPLDEAAILAEDALIPREKIPIGPTTQLSLFGTTSAEGRSFVFVIDRSNSMGSRGLGAIQTAAKELAARIDQLTSEQTFQVVAYNEAVVYLTQRELIPATTENKRKLVKFVADLAAFGQTDHSRGLLSALRMKPEIVFLLTDAGDPPLDAGQLQLIREQASARTSIHCVQFGRGPAPESKNFLARLAAENRGSYVYVDMNAR